ncbi:citrate/2-methylcitrate synthase [Enhygromyxa salina]|uniref:citrate synthase (unknown stereospecificity) n=1 Tax=Enhygromyxa salina TaxID=215803 RepID=A0A2S9YSD5_9BACT|nr:citrate/2-methylcitrate synthase [Enhygromyxa salina]PRQ08003.1 citrate synthase [Enhygromyxa salina]
MSRLPTRVAKTGWGDHRFQGYAVYAELLGHTSIGQVLALCMGVRLDAEQGAVLDEMFVSSLLADPHIWPLKLSRVAGAHGGSTMTGLAAGLLALEGKVTGSGPAGPMSAWLHRLVELEPSAARDEIQASVSSGQRLPGFGVPARKADERVIALTRCLVARGRHTMPHWAMWAQIAELSRTRGVEPNIASAFSAAALDLGIPPGRVEPLFAMALLPCFLPNAVEGAEQQPEILREVPREDLEYRGAPRRPSLRAAATGDPTLDPRV